MTLAPSRTITITTTRRFSNNIYIYIFIYIYICLITHVLSCIHLIMHILSCVTHGNRLPSQMCVAAKGTVDVFCVLLYDIMQMLDSVLLVLTLVFPAASYSTMCPFFSCLCLFLSWCLQFDLSCCVAVCAPTVA